MKVIFRVTKDMPIKDRIYYARNIRNAWNETHDMDCMVCFADDVEVYVVDSDTETEVEATAKEIDSPSPTVEAIPIEWIKQQANKYVEEDENGDDIWKEHLEWLIKEWEKENEQQ